MALKQKFVPIWWYSCKRHLLFWRGSRWWWIGRVDGKHMSFCNSKDDNIDHVKSEHVRYFEEMLTLRSLTALGTSLGEGKPRPSLLLLEEYTIPENPYVRHHKGSHPKKKCPKVRTMSETSQTPPPPHQTSDALYDFKNQQLLTGFFHVCF